MAEQLWKGRFSKAVDSRVNDFNSSIRFDQRMIAQVFNKKRVRFLFSNERQSIFLNTSWSKTLKKPHDP